MTARAAENVDAITQSSRRNAVHVACSYHRQTAIHRIGQLREHDNPGFCEFKKWMIEMMAMKWRDRNTDGELQCFFVMQQSSKSSPSRAKKSIVMSLHVVFLFVMHQCAAIYGRSIVRLGFPFRRIGPNTIIFSIILFKVVVYATTFKPSFQLDSRF